MFAPRFQITSGIATSLMSIEADRQAVIELPVNVGLLESLHETARLMATHYSTQIEGNKLTEAQVREALAGATFPGRQRDEAEVRNYYRALEQVEELARELGPIEEADIQRIHGLVMAGRPSATPYRDGQNVIRDSQSGAIVYMPPEAGDVAALMRDLVDWISRESDARELPVPIIAALAHYQFATIHPYYDGNGRTARLMTTLLLHKFGYGLKGIYNLEEYYARNLNRYHENLAVGHSHNYYFGRAEADVTGFIRYFCAGMAESFAAVRAAAAEAASRGTADRSTVLRDLGPRERRLLGLFRDQATADSSEIAAHLGLRRRTATALCAAWVKSGFLKLQDPSRKSRSYRLAPEYEILARDYNH